MKDSLQILQIISGYLARKDYAIIIALLLIQSWTRYCDKFPVFLRNVWELSFRHFLAQMSKYAFGVAIISKHFRDFLEIS